MVGEPELAQLARQRKTLEPMPSNAGVMGDMLGGATRLGRVLINWTCWARPNSDHADAWTPAELYLPAP